MYISIYVCVRAFVTSEEAKGLSKHDQHILNTRLKEGCKKSEKYFHIGKPSLTLAPEYLQRTTLWFTIHLLNLLKSSCNAHHPGNPRCGD